MHVGQEVWCFEVLSYMAHTQGVAEILHSMCKPVNMDDKDVMKTVWNCADDDPGRVPLRNVNLGRTVG